MKNSPLLIRELRDGDEQAFLEGLSHWAPEDLGWYTFEWSPGMSFVELLDRHERNKLGVGLPANRVANTMFYGFAEGRIVGRIHLRHRLNENLLLRGGHFGYAVAAPYRQRGYATEMVRQLLAKCPAYGLDRVLVTCADDNPGSYRIIERFGGRLENRIWDEVDEEMIRRYWIDLP